MTIIYFLYFSDEDFNYYLNKWDLIDFISVLLIYGVLRMSLLILVMVAFVCLCGDDLCGKKDYNRYGLIILHKLADIYCYCILL